MKKLFVIGLVLVVLFSWSVNAREIHRQFHSWTVDIYSFVLDQPSNTNTIEISGVLRYYNESWDNYWNFSMIFNVAPTINEANHGSSSINLINVTNENGIFYSGIPTFHVTRYDNLLGINYKIEGYISLLNKGERIGNSLDSEVLSEVRGFFSLTLIMDNTTFNLTEARIIFDSVIDDKDEISFIEIQLEKLKQYLFYRLYQGTDICNAIKNECPKEYPNDDDRDGIPNNGDECPDTKLGEDVDSDGCSNPQFCLKQAQCGLSCDLADWKNNEPFVFNPHDCVTVIIERGGTLEPICAGLSCAD